MKPTTEDVIEATLILREGQAEENSHFRIHLAPAHKRLQIVILQT